MRINQDIHSEPKEGPVGKERLDTHPAFGVATVTRGHGTGTALFQSDLLHNETITLAISEADRTRSLNRDWVHSTHQLVEIEMSLAQWGALISSIGIGSGVPVTVRRKPGEPLTPGIPYEPRIAESLSEVRTSVDHLMEKSRDSLSALEEAIESKAGIRAIRDALRAHRATIDNAPANAEFAVKSVAEAAEKVAAQAKADIESHVLAAAQQTGLTASVQLPALDSFVAGDDSVDTQLEAGHVDE
ncbi:hypothetical protein EDF62_1544 [Leucobacter luti]|uniref:Uncharacterized protein n=1 Tax=Leucobacter luti TaxID=340320 RepID=A0A4V6PVN8_9MICO|nr:hypothetical protein [Leucobacter luti]TDP92338.1 hypothetical protein EDF62_1544 [Leucobacter luti]